MRQIYDMKHGIGVEKIFIKRDQDSSICFTVAKMVDEVLMAGKAPSIQALLRDLDGQFPLGATNTGRDIRPLACTIKLRHDGSTDISMADYLTRGRTVHITRERNQLPNCQTKTESAPDIYFTLEP